MPKGKKKARRDFPIEIFVTQDPEITSDSELFVWNSPDEAVNPNITERIATYRLVTVCKAKLAVQYEDEK